MEALTLFQNVGGTDYSTTKCQISEVLSYHHMLRLFEEFQRQYLDRKDMKLQYGGEKLHGAEVLVCIYDQISLGWWNFASLWYAELVAHMVNMMNVYRAVVGVPEGKIPFGRPYLSWNYRDRDTS